MVFAVDSIDGEGLETKAALEKAGVTVELIHADSESSSLDIGKVLVRLGELGIDSVLVESGGSLNAAFFFGSEAAENLSLVQEIQVYVAPKIFGNDGHTINTPVHGKGIDFPKDAKIFSAPEIEIFGDDILLKYKPGKINSLEK
jgi:diaminohydroxyphosphoribosylaminopyrimidine deaminase/5-amino-6-(5-phosphoribosylamino)uracil reductase